MSLMELEEHAIEIAFFICHELGSNAAKEVHDRPGSIQGTFTLRLSAMLPRKRFRNADSQSWMHQKHNHASLSSTELPVSRLAAPRLAA